MLEWFKVTATSLGTRARAVLATMQGVSSAERKAGAEVIYPFGFVARPRITDTLWAIAVRLGDDWHPLALRDKGTAGHSPTLEEGEVRTFNLDGAVLRLRGNGSVDLVTASGQAIRLGAQGGTANKPVAHEGSRTTGHAHTVVFALTAPSGGGAVTGTITVNSNTDTIATGEGSSHVLVPDT